MLTPPLPPETPRDEIAEALRTPDAREDACRFWMLAVELEERTPTTVIFDPLVDQDAFWQEITQKALRNYGDFLRQWTTTVAALVPGSLRTAARNLGQTNPRLPFPSAFQIVTQLYQTQNSGVPVVRWRNKGRTRLWVTKMGQTTPAPVTRRPHRDPARMARFYDKHRSCELAQRWLIDSSARLTEPIEGFKPRSLKAVGRIRNAELRRAIIAAYGLRVTTEKPFAVDEVGELYAVAGDVNALRVVCPSTGREYWLGVPATTRSQAVDIFAGEGVVITDIRDLDTPTKARDWTFNVTKDHKLIAAA